MVKGVWFDSQQIQPSGRKKLPDFKDKGDWTSLGPLCVPVLESFLTRFIYILKATKQIIKTILKNSFFRKRDPTSTKYLWYLCQIKFIPTYLPTLDIKMWNKWKYEDNLCVLCEAKEESMDHFMQCSEYGDTNMKMSWFIVSWDPIRVVCNIQEFCFEMMILTFLWFSVHIMV